MNRRSVWTVLLLLLLVGSNAYWLFLHAPEASSNMASGTACSVEDADVEGASDIDKPVIPEEEYQ